MMKTWEQIRKEFFDPYKFNTATNLYNASGEIKVVKGCNAFIVTNIGDTVVRFNGEFLFPSATPLTVAGDSLSNGGNLGELYVGQMILEFVQPVGALPQVTVTQKFYTNFDQ